MSTSLQRDFFAKHPEIMFLGWGRPETEHGWVNDQFATLCEVGIRYEKVLSYDKSFAKRMFRGQLKEFNNDAAKKVLCLSSESFSFTMHFDVDATIKAQRLKHLMGDNTKVLIVIRNQLDLFRSYYFECVRGGYPGQFDEFLDFNYHYLFHSILSDLNYYDLYALYCRHFGEENVKVLPMESIIEDQDKSLSELSIFAGISDVELKLQRHNDSSDKKYLQAVRWLNEKFPNNRGNSYFGFVDGEKLHTYWRDKLLMPESVAASQNYAARMMIYRSAHAVISDFVTDIGSSYPLGWQEKLGDLYAAGNDSLSKAIDIDLGAMGYPELN